MNALTGCTSADLRATQNLRATHFFLLLHGRLVCACAMHIVCLLIALREMSARPLLCAQRGAKRFLLAHFFSAYESARPDLRITLRTLGRGCPELSLPISLFISILSLPLYLLPSPCSSLTTQKSGTHGYPPLCHPASTHSVHTHLC